jgi:hypothetical protein
METKDLRLGNLVISKFNNVEEVGIITGIPDHDGCLDINEVGYIIEDCNPIPLTNEWLIKLGFELDTNIEFNWHVWDNGEFTIHDPLNDGETFVWFLRLDKMCAESIDVDYVHSLQNLYFALTDKELEIKLKQ